MKQERLYIFDTTLRDGQQTAGVNFSVEDKICLARLLDELGVDYVEGGYPGANPTDTEFFASPLGLSRAKLTAFGMTKRAGRDVDKDPGLAALFKAKAKTICLVAKSWDYHVDVALNITKEENLVCIKESVEAILAVGREAIIDCEHFFDGYKANPQFALACAKTAFEAGARWVVLCDTNGGTFPNEVGKIVGEVAQHIDGAYLGIHAHNDTEQAVANSLAAVRAGVRQVQGTINGLGERCGNANLVSLIPNLLLKEPFQSQFKTNIWHNKLQNLSALSLKLDDILNRVSNQSQPYIGANAFAHKGGIHVSAVMKNPTTYEHIDPALVGNKRKVIISNQAGRANVMARLDMIGIKLSPNAPELKKILDEVKRREKFGYSFDNAGASFELLVYDALGTLPKFFEVNDYLVSVRSDHKNNKPMEAEAELNITINGESFTRKGKGNGPVNALDNALRKDLGIYAPYLKDMRLLDYKVRILNTGTNATTCVFIDSTDKNGNVWRCVGVSENIIAASFQALCDSIIYKLLISKAQDRLAS